MKSPLNSRIQQVFRCIFLLLTFGHLQNVFAVDCWNDDDLSALEKTQVNTVIYVWSPRMALSALHADDVAEQARAAGLAFVPIVDGRVPAAEWRSAVQAVGLTKPGLGDSLKISRSLCGERLTTLDAYQHFPSVFLVRSGQLQPGKWTGAMNPSTWAGAFKSGLKLQATSNSFTQASQLVDSISSPVDLVRTLDPRAVEKPLPDRSCIAANQFVALPPQLAGRGTDQAVALGAYERVSPDGRFVLRSYSGKDLSTVSLIELPAPTPQSNQRAATVVAITQTPLSNEAFPVQGSWRYIVDTNGQHYAFSDLVKRQKQAKPYFQGGMFGFYAASAEVASTYPMRSSNVVQIRSLSWPNAGSDSDTVGEGMLSARTITVEPDQNRLLGDSGRINLCLGRVSVDGSLYSLPMISVDGQHYSALPQRPVNNVSTMRIFGFGTDGKQCLPEQQFTSPSGKVTFGFSPKGQGANLPPHADVVYEYRGQAWWYASQLATALNLAPVEEPPASPKESYRKNIIASAFPGLTRDGRVIYAATWQLCSGSACTDEAGYIVSDPYQSNAHQQIQLARQTASSVAKPSQSCIATSDVMRERADFANFHGIPLK